MSISTEITNVVALYPPRKDVEEPSLDEFLEALAEQVRGHSRSTSTDLQELRRELPRHGKLGFNKRGQSAPPNAVGRLAIVLT